MSDKLVEGKVAIITGSGRGLGREHALLLAEHGAKVLNAQAVEWAQRAGIVIHARKTTAPASG